MKQFYVEMSELVKDSSILGNKVKNLASLNKTGLKIPRGFGLFYDVYSKHVKKLMPMLSEALEKSVDYVDMANQMRKIIITSPFLDEKRIYDAINIHMPDASYFAVRSSGSPVLADRDIAEDSEKCSLAGQYDSFLQVPLNNIPNAILSCFASLFNERSLRQFNVKENKSYLNSRMSVLIQEMFNADLSAVIMTRDPVEKNDCFGIEITYGACESLVSGFVQGDLYLLDRGTGRIIDTQLGTKSVRIGYEPFVSATVDNSVRFPVEQEFATRFAASEQLVSKIYQLGMSVERHFNAPQDIELVVSGNELVIVQTRPITASNYKLG